jgi:hypothetical protein
MASSYWVLNNTFAGPNLNINHATYSHPKHDKFALPIQGEQKMQKKDQSNLPTPTIRGNDRFLLT